MTTQAKKRYDVLSPHEYMLGEEKKTRWTPVGVAFKTQDGEGFNIELTPNLAVSGRLVIREYKPKTDTKAE
ncbi:hypothetical protein [Pseudomonas alabamensis]|uniref:hypothetical protein n=1 Tax=Pseudomonas alabamensis TaxID=3064349 RepID=UPI0011AA818C